MIPIATELKKECKIPIFCANIHKPELGEAALKAGKIDMIALGRPLNADPDYVNKCAEQGKGAKITKCIRCMICSRRSRFNLSFRCEVNREVGNEKYDTKNWRINAPYKKQYWIPNDY
jgi:2,4-dienoyl-CoA reductase-like NADH-dependent reductase (Old Yellow Enzyme family)